MLPADHGAQVHAMKQPELVAEIHVLLPGLDEQQSEVRLRVNPHGPFGKMHAHGKARAAAYEQLMATV